MNVGRVSLEYLDAICEGCLSPDRVLNEITELEIKKVFCELLNDCTQVDPNLKLCFECKSKLEQLVTFRQQVQKANDTLIKYRRDSSIFLPRLSTLNIALNVTTTSYPSHSDLEPEIQDLVTFVKIEDDFVLDDDFDDKELQTVLKSENESNQTEAKQGTNVIAVDSSEKNIEDDFNESDEEPLNKKKKKTTGIDKVKKGRGKKTGGKATSKIDGRTLKQEDPPGVVRNARVLKKLQSLNVADGQIEMVLLSWEQVEEERQKALSSVVFTRHEHRCYECIVGFNHTVKLHNHMNKHTPIPGGLMCSVCKIWCKDAHALCAHRRRHRVRWRCCACGVQYSSACVCADHVCRTHGAPPPTHVCNMCGHTEQSLGKLRQHLKSHGESVKCELCGKCFRDKNALRTHLFIHKGEKEYACPRCDKRFLFKKAMEVHLVTHDASAHLYCYECDVNFKNQMSYTQHMKYTLKHVDPAKLKYACQLCDKKFVKAARLEEHNLSVHLKSAHITCTVNGCNFTCSSRTVLRTHSRMVHRNARLYRNHVCHTCGKTYTTKKCLEGHLRSHTGERPFKCAICPSTFGYEAALYNHNRLVHLKNKVSRSRQTNQQEPTQVLHPPIVNTSTEL